MNVATNNMTNQVVKKKRKQRRALDGYADVDVDIDNVIATAGDNFVTWIKITKQKLKEREVKFMTVRINTLQKIINEECRIFGTRLNLQVSECEDLIGESDVIDACLNKLYLALQLWNGVNLSKTKKSLSTFRNYFVIGKGWYDQTKKNILAPVFWIPIFLTLQEFCVHSAARYFNNNWPDLQKLYAKSLGYQIMCGIFHGKSHYAARKPQPLISCGILKESYPLQQYLISLDPSLNIQTLKTGTGKITAKQTLLLINKQLVHLRDGARDEFRRALTHSQFEQMQFNEFEFNQSQSQYIANEQLELDHLDAYVNLNLDIDREESTQSSVHPAVPAVHSLYSLHSLLPLLPPSPLPLSPLPLSLSLSSSIANTSLSTSINEIEQSQTQTCIPVPVTVPVQLQTISNHMDNHHNNNSNNAFYDEYNPNEELEHVYEGIHGSSQSVISRRYSPMSQFNINSSFFNDNHTVNTINTSPISYFNAGITQSQYNNTPLPPTNNNNNNNSVFMPMPSNNTHCFQCCHCCCYR